MVFGFNGNLIARLASAAVATATFTLLATTAGAQPVQGGPLFARECAVCHGAQGEGGDGPKLAGNANTANSQHVINQVLRGGQYMPPFGDSLNDTTVAAILTFVRSNWGNNYPAIQAADVAKERLPR